MQEELPECFCVVSQQKAFGSDTIEAALKEIHAFVFGKRQENVEESSPFELIKACESAVEKVGGRLGKRNPVGMALLSMGVVIVEIMARLTRILFWGILAPSELSLPRRRKMIEEYGEELEEVLLPRFFLKLSASPTILRDVLLRAPWEAFLRRYGTESTPSGESRDVVPAEVASVLSSLRVNFGCDFLIHVRLQAALAGSHLVVDNTAAEANAFTVTTACDSSRSLSTLVEAVGGDTKTTGRDKTIYPFGAKTCHPPSVLSTSVPHASLREGKMDRRSFLSSVKQSQGNCLVHSHHRLPAYKLTRRRVVMRAGSGAGNTSVDCSTSGANPYSSASDNDHASAEEQDGDAEVLAPETPVKKRVRKDKGVVPPSPSRPTHEGMARLFDS
ncbi:hypothetical protein TraAM80_02631 [Trypanosoma rangeli]|uniref:Uncharacterized protein n=1 Tax=Trypanosoma rangeli TaxID=5698 RepID=A0A3R7NMK7_TRYRA|nr:uncharacterized protein TraAM80_02631 [Trypanosoma rangeli]RNF08698.1 hypothetical protein TraAM80_02631 [Trypanosoma rangeli]|eukprot:RNF08698.1 hypothetical protein TraAM80_02631 [Trypanosoma rangeli]